MHTQPITIDYCMERREYNYVHDVTLDMYYHFYKVVLMNTTMPCMHANVSSHEYTHKNFSSLECHIKKTLAVAVLFVSCCQNCIKT